MDELKEEFGFGYETMKASIDETALGDRTADPSKLVRLLAHAKADAIVKRYSLNSGFLITCDQVASYENTCLLAHHSLHPFLFG